VQQADVEVDDLVLSPLAAAEAVLTEQEKNLGVVLVDVGHGTTDISIFVDGSVWHTKVLPVGGWHLTNDLVIVFNIPYEAAEALKLEYGRAMLAGANQYFAQAPSTNGKSQPQAQPAYSHAYSNGAQGTSRPNGSGASREALDLGPVFGESEDNKPGKDLEDDLIETHTFEGTPRLISRSDLNEVMAARFDQISVGLVLWGMKQNAQSSVASRLPRSRRGTDSANEQTSTLAKWLKGFLPHG
jgi:hypothetical protein